MTKTELELALLFAAKIAKDSDFLVLGSQSILGSVKKPPKACLVSREVDLYPRKNYQASGLVLNALGPRSKFFKRHGFFVDCVSPEIATLPNGWVGRLVPFRVQKKRSITGWCLEPHDLAASKLAAGRQKDIDFVHELMRHRVIRRASLKGRIRDLPIRESAISEIICALEQKKLKKTIE
jgi:hypothetical protein